MSAATTESSAASRNVALFANFLRARRSGSGRPLFVALDGRSGSGKSTLAELVVREFNAGHAHRPVVTVIEGDQFYAGGSHTAWDARSAAEKADGVIDWRRQRHVLQTLRAQGEAYWHPFDWESKDWDADNVPLASEPIRSILTNIVILEGAYSARPELADLIDMRVLVRVPEETRRARLRRREGDAYQADWEARWAEAEEHYFGSIVPAAGFDLVLESD